MNTQKTPTSPTDVKEKIHSNMYLSAIGSLNYLSVATRPAITYSVHYLEWFSADPRRQHWNTVEHRGTPDTRHQHNGSEAITHSAYHTASQYTPAHVRRRKLGGQGGEVFPWLHNVFP